MRASRWMVVGCFALFASAASAQSMEQILEASQRAYQQGERGEAVAVLEERIANPQPGDDLFQLHGISGDLYLELNETEQALAHYDWLIAQNPDSARAHYKRGLVLERTSAMLEAIASYQHAGKLGYNQAEVLTRSGFCYKVLAGRPKTSEPDRTRYLRLARSDLEGAVQRGPKSNSALGNLADLAFNQGEHHRALELYYRMAELEPDRPMTLARIGSTHLRLGEHQTALDFLLRAAEIVEAKKPVGWGDRWLFRDVTLFSRVRAAECLMALGRPDEARRQIARVLKIANCPDCNTTTRETETSRARAEELLAHLDSTAPANAESSH